MNNIAECILRKEFVLDKISFDNNDYFKFIGNAKLTLEDILETKSYSNDEFVVSIGRTISSDEENIFSVSVFFDVHFILKDNVGEIAENDVDTYIKENYEDFTNICMAKISLLISQITAQLGKGVPIISPPHFTKNIASEAK